MKGSKLGKALADFEQAALVKAHVHRRATTRRTAHGVVQVRSTDYEDSRQRRQRAADGDPRGSSPRSRPKRKSKAELDAHRPFADADPALVGAIKAANAAQTVLRRFADQPDNPAYKAAQAKLEAAQKLIRRHAGGGSAAPSTAREKEAIGPIKGANRKKPPESPPKKTRKTASRELAKDALKPKKIASPEYRKAKADAKRAKDVASHGAKLKAQEREHAAKLARQADEHKAALAKQAAEHQADLSRTAEEHKAKLGKEAAVHQAQLGGIGDERKGRVQRQNAEHAAQIAEQAAKDKIDAQNAAMGKFKNGDAVVWGRGELISSGTIIGPATGSANKGKVMIQPTPTKFDRKPKAIMMEPEEIKKDTAAARKQIGKLKRGGKPTGKDALDAIDQHFKTAKQIREEAAAHHDKTRQEMVGKNDKAPGPGQRGSFYISHWDTPTKKVQGIHSPHAPGLMVYREGKANGYAIHHIKSGAKVLDGYESEASALNATARLGAEHPQHGRPDWTKPEKEVKDDKAAGENARSEYKNNPKNIFGKRLR